MSSARYCRDDYLIDLRKTSDALRYEMCFGGKFLSRSKGVEMHRQHKELGTAISRRRQELRRMRWDQVKKAYHSEMPIVEIDKQIEHERIADAFFAPTAETFTGAEALSRRIQVVNDLAVLCELREPPRHGPKLDWSRYDEEIDLEGTEISTADSSDNVTSKDASHVADPCFPSLDILRPNFIT